MDGDAFWLRVTFDPDPEEPPGAEMFERRRAVLSAAAVGYLLSGFLLALTAGSVYFVTHENPYRLERDWEKLLTLRAQFVAVGVVAALLLFAIAVAGVLVGLAMATRAARLHPTSAGLGGLFLAAAMLALVAMGVWTGLVSTYAALQYYSVSDELHKHALLLEARLNEHAIMLAFWSFLVLAAIGLYFLGRALRGERGWLPDVLKLAAALILLNLPMTIYLASESLLYNRYPRWLAATDQLLLWGGLAAASYLCARWLRAVGRALPR